MTGQAKPYPHSPQDPWPENGQPSQNRPIQVTIMPRAGTTLRASGSRKALRRQSQFFNGQRDLPVLGRAQGGSEGNMTLGETALDWTFRPADLQGVSDAFAVYVTGDSMLPKYKSQDLAYVHPTKTPRRGRYVLIETTEHTGFIKQFVKWDGAELVLNQFNPAQEIRLPRESVLRVLLVIGSLDA